jgi:hypothetical protein
MCWNAEASINSFIIGIFGILFAALNHAPPSLLLFVSLITPMQLIEYFVWKYYNNPRVNLIASLCAGFLLLIQPLGSIATLYPTQSKIMWSLLKQYSSIIFCYLIYIFITQRETYKSIYRMHKAANGHLAWNFVNLSLTNFIPFLIYFWYLLYPQLLIHNYTYIGFGIVTLLFSLYTYHKYNTWGSLWCWMVNFIILTYVVNVIVSKLPRV